MMARFDERATKPVRGPGDILRWKLGKKEPRHERDRIHSPGGVACQ
jgi:hypothetical protein